MSKNKKRILILPGDGIGPEVSVVAKKLLVLLDQKYSLDLDKEADNLENAVQDVLNDGLRTKDIAEKGKKEVSTKEMGDAIISKLK